MHKEIKFHAGIFLFLIFYGFLIYANALQSPFIWDDKFLISENHFITHFKYIGEIFTHHLYYSSAGLSNFYRPLQSLCIMLDYAIWKNNPFGYHLTSVLFHIGCAFLIYLFIFRLFLQRTIAFLTSLLFLVHPIHSTVVDYISSRADSQATFFILLALVLFIKGIHSSLSQSVDAKKKTQPLVSSKIFVKKIYYIGSLFSFILALLSKELAIITPFLLLLSGATVCAKDIKSAYAKKTMPFFIILIVYFFLRATIFNFPDATAVNPPVLSTRLLTTIESFVRLMGLLLFPTHIHIEKSIPFSRGIFQMSTFISLCILLLIVAFIMQARARRLRICFFGMLWFFIALIPMSNIVPINTTLADHWLYLPGFGFLLTVVGGVHYFIQILPPRIRRSVLITVLLLYIGVIGVFSLLTVKQNIVWADPLTFFKKAIEYSPGSYRPHNEIGILYLEKQWYDEAISEFQKAIALNPKFDQPYDNMGVAYDMKEDFENAVAAHKKAIELNPNSVKAYNNLGNAYNNAGRLDEAIEAYQAALKLNPQYKALYNNLGVVYYKKGMFKEARLYWQKALAIDPNFSMSRNNIRILDEMSRQ
ncbi:MAG: tetratricopeptide repeat protein [Candidatus Omnitrophota bacterium]